MRFEEETQYYYEIERAKDIDVNARPKKKKTLQSIINNRKISYSSTYMKNIKIKHFLSKKFG